MPGPPRDPSKWLTVACGVCGLGFECRVSAPRVYCGIACRGKAVGHKPDPSKRARTHCPGCRKEFEYLLTWPRKYCSNRCAGQANVTNIQAFAPSRRTCVCTHCDGQFITTAKRSRGRFCSRACYAAWQRANARPRPAPERAAIVARRPRPLIVCVVCGATFTVKRSELGKRRCCSRACQGADLAHRWSGPNNPLWAGGYEPYYGPSWRAARRAARRRDGRCVDCGATAAQVGRELDVHHIRPFRLFGVPRHHEANRLDNLVTLCSACHTRREWVEGRGLETPSS